MLVYPINRLADACYVGIGIAMCLVLGAYTFLDILVVQRAPHLAFNFNYWKNQQFTRVWKAFGATASRKAQPLLIPLASIADKVVLDIG